MELASPKNGSSNFLSLILEVGDNAMKRAAERIKQKREAANLEQPPEHLPALKKQRQQKHKIK